MRRAYAAHMKHAVDTCWVFALIISFTASVGLAQSGWSDLNEDITPSVSAIILDIVNSPDARSDLRNLQRHLTDMGVHLESHSKLIRLARRLGLRSEETDEPEVLRMLAKRLRVNYFIILDYVDETELKVTLVSGETGHEDWTKRFGLPGGFLKDRHWYALATQLSREMSRGPGPAHEMTAERPASKDSASSLPTLSIHAGALAINRTFAASGIQSVDNPLTGGIEYDLGFVPGFTIDAEIAPLTAAPKIGMGIGYERAFFRTKQTIVVPIASSGAETSSETVKLLESSYSQIYARLFYRKALDGGIELTGGLKTRLLSFSIDGDSEYTGVDYLTLDFELGSF